MSTVEERDERVARGAVWLDEVAPGWADRMNMEEFDFSLQWHCVLGQTLGWNDGRDALVVAAHRDGFDGGRSAIALLIAHGFDRDGEDVADTWGDMDEAWRRAIAARRTPDPEQ